MRSLNRLKWLHAFEASARHGSFTAAADELGVTPAAVGQLVRSLEEWVGHPLFERTRSGKERLTLTQDARSAVEDIAQGLDKLESGLGKLRERRERRVVVITASQVLMMNWLMLRLNAFSEQHGSIDFRLDVSDRLTDLVHGEADIGIRCGSGYWPDLDSTWLMDEEAVMVCSPFLLSNTTTADALWLAAQRLIHDDTPHPGANFPDWETVLVKLGVHHHPSHQERHINSTSAAILAALGGQGVVLVRRALVQQALETGQLVQLFGDTRWPLSWSYFVVSTKQSYKRKEVALFRDWMLKEMQSTETAR